MSGTYQGKQLHTITDQEAQQLCADLRKTLIDTVSKTGGHLASNLGIVELTVALHRVWDPERDRIVFDVGHQCYTHKILTGRAEEMKTLRSLGGIAGFPKPSESPCDAFAAGHASTSVSAAVGMARARTIKREDYDVIAVIGDGALTGGLAYEGLSDAGASGEKLLVVLNDNGMSITKNVGAIANYLARRRLKPQYLNFKKVYRRTVKALPGGERIYRFTHKLKQLIKSAILPCSMFEEMGFTYLGPVDGHDVANLTRLLRYAKETDGPVMLHIRTVKGKGYAPAERTPDQFHGVGKFDAATGEPLRRSGESFSSVFGRELCALAREDQRICAVTAAMESGTGLSPFADEFPERFFDIGIAEGHAVTMSAGLASQGLLPVFAVYSTFLQRAYDMILHDVALQHLHVVFAVDRAGLVGEDGETHHGVFDPAFLNTVPGMTVLCPASFAEVGPMLRTALYECTGPVAVRYPRGGESIFREDRSAGSACLLRPGRDVTLVGYGTMIGELLSAADTLQAQGIEAEIIKLNTITPVDTALIEASVKRTGRLVIVEEATAMGSVGERLTAHLAQLGALPACVQLCTLGGEFVTHASVPELRSLCHIDAASIANTVREVCADG